MVWHPQNKKTCQLFSKYALWEGNTFNAVISGGPGLNTGLPASTHNSTRGGNYPVNQQPKMKNKNNDPERRLCRFKDFFPLPRWIPYNFSSYPCLNSNFFLKGLHKWQPGRLTKLNFFRGHHGPLKEIWTETFHSLLWGMKFPLKNKKKACG